MALSLKNLRKERPFPQVEGLRERGDPIVGALEGALQGTFAGAGQPLSASSCRSQDDVQDTERDVGKEQRPTLGEFLHDTHGVMTRKGGDEEICDLFRGNVPQKSNSLTTA